MRFLLTAAAIIFTVACDTATLDTGSNDITEPETSSRVEYIYMPELIINAGEERQPSGDLIIFTEEESRKVFSDSILTVSLKD